jgi:hypothetical protein
MKVDVTKVELLIFIDSNIYLRFYDSNQPDFKQLLKSLIQLKGHIFVTRQIVDEVVRNKCQIFEQTFFNYLKQVNQTFNNVQLPEHLDIEKDEKIKEWNKRRKKLKEQNDHLINDLKEIYKSTFYKIACSTDEVSRGLDEIFKSAITETNIEFELAVKRKEFGNPPGKNNDCLGDQINWEQLLKKASGIKRLLIISNDYDYFVETNDTLLLNPSLKREIMDLNPLLEINCFNKLSNGLKSISDQNTNKSVVLPKPSIMKQIIIDEPETYLNSQDENIGNYQMDFYKEHPKLMDALTRLNYMYNHGMIATDELSRRLQKLGANDRKISKIIGAHHIPFTNDDFFEDFF